MNVESHVLVLMPHDHPTSGDDFAALVASSEDAMREMLRESKIEQAVATAYCIDEPAIERDRRLGLYRAPRLRATDEPLSIVEEVERYTGGAEFHDHPRREDDYLLSEGIDRVPLAGRGRLERVSVYIGWGPFPGAVFSSAERLRAWVRTHRLRGLMYEITVDARDPLVHVPTEVFR